MFFLNFRIACAVSTLYLITLKMKINNLFFVTILTLYLCICASTAESQTYCNPLDINYGYLAGKPVQANISDPTMVLFKDKYFLFASNTVGYWYSADLHAWKFVPATVLALKNNEPTAAVIGDWMYCFKSLSDTIFRSQDPEKGKWEVFATNSTLLPLISDFAVFEDTDGRVYCYYGCTNNDGVMVRELDPADNLNPIGLPTVCRRESQSDTNQKKSKTKTARITSYNVRGSWMVKNNGKYYFHSSELNPVLKNYADVVYTADSPLGPFTIASSNPFCYLPDGFVSGAGNGSTFADKTGNWWHVGTLTAVNDQGSQMRLGLFPASFDQDGNPFSSTYFGDYPMTLSRKTTDDIFNLRPDWSLLSFKTPAKSSSAIATYSASLAFDENIGTYWCAQTGDKGEWLSTDLGSVCTLKALQLNFVEHKVSAVDYDSIYAYKYLVEYSADRKNWKVLVDKTANTEFQPNPYEELVNPVQARYLRITNYHVPWGAFAISGFRVFGKGQGNKPKKATGLRMMKDYNNPQFIKLYWDKQDKTTSYQIRYGAGKNKLYHSHLVYRTNRASIFCPDYNADYWFEVDAFNENGISPGKPELSTVK